MDVSEHCQTSNSIVMAKKNVRNTNTKNTFDVIPTIIGAGITEQYYFEHLKNLFGYRLKIRPRFFGNENIYYIEQRIKQVLDEGGRAICVFDADVTNWDAAEKKKLEELKRKYGNKSDVLICDSLPSIEYWFLLHFKNTTRFFNTSKEAERELSAFIRNYEKHERFLSKPDWVMQMTDDEKQSEAITRAKDIGIQEKQSYTNVYKAIEDLKKR